MNRAPLTVIMCAVFPLLAGCFTIKIDERTAFAPEKREVPPATTVSELDDRMAANFQSGVDEGIWRINKTAEGALQIAFREDWRHRKATLPDPIELRNGFFGKGDKRVAWTLYTRPSEAAAPSTSLRPLVVHCAGNAGDRYNSGADYAAKALAWADVLIFDYPGYGDTPGPASASAFENASTILTENVIALSQNRKLVFWGHSLGGFVCSRLASSIPQTDGLVLETTAPDAEAVAKAWTPAYARLFVRTSVVPSLASYDVVTAATRVNGPVLVLGAAKDKVLPVVLARQVADGLKSRNVAATYFEFPNASHMNVPSQAEFNGVIADFFKSVESRL